MNSRFTLYGLGSPVRITAAVVITLLIVLTTACGSGNENGAASDNGQKQAEESRNNNAAQGSAEQKNEDASDEADEPKLQVITSFYPLQYMVEEIGGERVEARSLVAAGVEPHDWTPKSRDLQATSNAALFLYHGAGLEGWVDDFLGGLSKGSSVVAKEMSQGISLITGEGVHVHGEHDEDGHQDDEHEHGENKADEQGNSHSSDIDPHTWVSPKSALILANNVKDSLIEADESHAEYYQENYEALRAKLEELDKRYSEELGTLKQKNIVVSHQAFGYLARDYGLTQESIMGLNPGAEPRAQDILAIAKFVKEHGVQYIFFEELVSDDLANMLAREAKVDTMVLNPLEGLTKEQEKNGETYLTLMERNLQNLILALQ
ncbi:metal ABC transporter solute-binding protein, Zn/Mn family [Paenibacillus chungangensis]|uniref:Metal ABC transporter solute-binding protein, Zn/Mn family n=1 Tax=Paenibacillus chungangensis TaxID=696535 RepID=A0ABW3HMI3_9BACL